MRILDQFRTGHVGTPEFGAVIAALIQFADAAAKGGLKCVAVPATAGASAAALNAAATGTFHRTVKLQLQDAANNVQKWFNGSATLTPTEAAADAQIGVPVVTGGNTVTFVDGEATVVLTYDTDAGATKTYAATDTVGFTTALANVLGAAVTVTGAVFLDTIVA
jgi:hypothetical protein